MLVKVVIYLGPEFVDYVGYFVGEVLAGLTETVEGFLGAWY